MDGSGGEEADEFDDEEAAVASILLRFASRTRWEVGEFVAAAVALALTIEVVSSIVYGFTLAQPGGSGGVFGGVAGPDRWELATNFAGYLFAFVLLAVPAVAWWQVERWAPALSETGELDPPVAPEAVSEAVNRALRVRWIVRWGGLLSITLVIASVVNFMTRVGNGELGDFSQAVVYVAELFMALLLAAAAGWAILFVLRRCSALLSVDDEETDDSDDEVSIETDWS